MVADEAVALVGVYPISFARDTTFFLICAVSKNNSDATIFALNAETCELYARRSISKLILLPSKS